MDVYLLATVSIEPFDAEVTAACPGREKMRLGHVNAALLGNQRADILMQAGILSVRTVGEFDKPGRESWRNFLVSGNNRLLVIRYKRRDFGTGSASGTVQPQQFIKAAGWPSSRPF